MRTFGIFLSRTAFGSKKFWPCVVLELRQDSRSDCANSPVLKQWDDFSTPFPLAAIGFMIEIGIWFSYHSEIFARAIWNNCQIKNISTTAAAIVSAICLVEQCKLLQAIKTRHFPPAANWSTIELPWWIIFHMEIWYFSFQKSFRIEKISTVRYFRAPTKHAVKQEKSLLAKEKIHNEHPFSAGCYRLHNRDRSLIFFTICKSYLNQSWIKNISIAAAAIVSAICLVEQCKLLQAIKRRHFLPAANWSTIELQ